MVGLLGRGPSSAALTGGLLGGGLPWATRAPQASLPDALARMGSGQLNPITAAQELGLPATDDRSAMDAIVNAATQQGIDMRAAMGPPISSPPVGPSMQDLQIQPQAPQLQPQDPQLQPANQQITRIAQPGETAAQAAGVPQEVAQQNPMALAESLLGAGEVPDRETIMEFMANGGVNLDPATTAWCAALVNGALGQAGIEGTGSNAARSFLDFGTGVDDPQRGDLAVFSRGDPSGWQGHVGFFDQVNPDGTIRVLGGNQGDAVSYADYSPDRLLGYRRYEPGYPLSDQEPGRLPMEEREVGPAPGIGTNVPLAEEQMLPAHQPGGMYGGQPQGLLGSGQPRGGLLGSQQPQGGGGLLGRLGQGLEQLPANPLFMAGMGLLGSSGPSLTPNNPVEGLIGGLGAASQNKLAMRGQEDAEARKQQLIEYAHQTGDMTLLQLAQTDPDAAVEYIQQQGEAPSNIRTMRQLGLDPSNPQDVQRAHELGVLGSGGTNVTINQPSIGSIPPGYTVEYGPDGLPVQMREIPGGPVEAERLEQERREASRQTEVSRAGNTVIQDLNRGLSRLDDMWAGGEGVMQGVLRAAEAETRGTPAYEVQQFIESARSNIGLDRLQQMRENSPTGGALGQVPFQQQQRLEQVLGSMHLGQSPEVVRENMKRIINIYLDITYGDASERAALMQRGELTSEQNDRIQGAYYGLPFDEFGRPVQPSTAPPAGSQQPTTTDDPLGLR